MTTNQGGKSNIVKNSACWACPIGFTRISKTDKVEGEGPEFETTWAFGAQCGVDDLPALEEACQIMLIAKQINEPFIEYRKMSGAYDKW